MKKNDEIYCRRCRNEDRAKKSRKGSGGIELILWLLFWITVFIPLIYTIWRRSGTPLVCPVCGSADIVPAWVHRNELQDARAAAAPPPVA